MMTTAITITMTTTGRDQVFITVSGSTLKVTTIIGDKAIIIIITTTAIIIMEAATTTVVEVIMMVMGMAAAVDIIKECCKILRSRKIDYFESIYHRSRGHIPLPSLASKVGGLMENGSKAIFLWLRVLQTAP